MLTKSKLDLSIKRQRPISLEGKLPKELRTHLQSVPKRFPKNGIHKRELMGYETTVFDVIAVILLLMIGSFKKQDGLD